MADYEIFELGDVVLSRGATIRNAKLAYKTFGTLSPKKDLYLPPADSEYEAEYMPNAELRVCETDWGHFAGGPGTSPQDVKFIDAALKELLAS